MVDALPVAVLEWLFFSTTLGVFLNRAAIEEEELDEVIVGC